MDGDARSKVGYGTETGENMLSSRFTAHEPDTAITIAASYAAKAFGIKTGTLAREARQLCPNVIVLTSSPCRPIIGSIPIILSAFCDRRHLPAD